MTTAKKQTEVTSANVTPDTFKTLTLAEQLAIINVMVNDKSIIMGSQITDKTGISSLNLKYFTAIVKCAPAYSAVSSGKMGVQIAYYTIKQCIDSGIDFKSFFTKVLSMVSGKHMVTDKVANAAFSEIALDELKLKLDPEAADPDISIPVSQLFAIASAATTHEVVKMLEQYA